MVAKFRLHGTLGNWPRILLPWDKSMVPAAILHASRPKRTLIRSRANFGDPGGCSVLLRAYQVPVRARTFSSPTLDMKKVYFKKRNSREGIASSPSIKGSAHSVPKNKLSLIVFPPYKPKKSSPSAKEIVAPLHTSIPTTMRLIAVFDLPVILLALVVGAAAAPSGSTNGGKPSPKSGLSPFSPDTLFFFD